MNAARPLHSVFGDLASEEGSSAGRDEVLAANGHPDLPDGLVAEAVVNYADTAPYEVAQHLAPYVRANSAVPQSEVDAAAPEPDWYGLLTTAPPVTEYVAGPDALDGDLGGLVASTGAATAAHHAGPADLEFGVGHGAQHTQIEQGHSPASDTADAPTTATEGFDDVDPTGLDADTLGHPRLDAADDDGDSDDDLDDLDSF